MNPERLQLEAGAKETVLVGLAKYSPFRKVLLVNHLVLSKATKTDKSTKVVYKYYQTLIKVSR